MQSKSGVRRRVQILQDVNPAPQGSNTVEFHRVRLLVGISSLPSKGLPLLALMAHGVGSLWIPSGSLHTWFRVKEFLCQPDAGIKADVGCFLPFSPKTWDQLSARSKFLDLSAGDPKSGHLSGAAGSSQGAAPPKKPKDSPGVAVSRAGTRWEWDEGM